MEILYIILGGVVGNFVALLGFVFAFVHKWGWINKAVENLEVTVKEHSKFDGRISTIEGVLRATKGDFVIGRSPFSLTEKGVALLKESGADKYVERHQERLLKEFEDVVAPYDIQKKAWKMMLEELETDDDIKDFVFRKGNLMSDVADVAGIALRDAVLEHKGIEVDGK